MATAGTRNCDIAPDGGGPAIAALAGNRGAIADTSGSDGELKFTVPGEPISWARSGHLGKQHFTPAKQRNYSATIKLFAQQSFRGKSLMMGPLSMEIVCTYAWPLSWSDKKRSANPFKVSRSDVDNLAKQVMDSLNGIVYRDDAQIVILNVTKLYGNSPQVEISLKELGV